MVVVQGVHARMSNGVVLNYAAVDVKKLFDNCLLNNDIISFLSHL